ncbi:hypothetical protein SBADM41S_06367 [Streptomyces badius]
MTDAKTANTLKKPRTVARPTSSRRLACREYTLAPSTPRNTKTVASMVPLTWSKRVPARQGPPLKLSAKTDGSKKKSARTTKRIGTIFATVTIRLIAAASLPPRRSARNPTAPATARGRGRRRLQRGATAPTVDMMAPRR